MKCNPPRLKKSENFDFFTTTYAHRFIINSHISVFILDGRREHNANNTKVCRYYSDGRKSHRTKKELRQREQAEKALLTGIPLKERQEVKDNEIAHKEFLRLKKLLEKINKFDDMYGAVINRYCILYAETKEFEEKRDQFYKQLCEFQNEKDDMLINRELTRKEYYGIEASMQKSLVSMDRQIQAKRRMLAEIEKENVMTIAASLRSVPKKPEKKTNPLKEALGG